MGVAEESVRIWLARFREGAGGATLTPEQRSHHPRKTYNQVANIVGAVEADPHIGIVKKETGPGAF